MLILSRKNGERIVIDGRITITVLKTRNQQVRLGIEAPPEIPVWRTEVVAEKETVVEGKPAWAAPSARKILCPAGKRLSRTAARSERL